MAAFDPNEYGSQILGLDRTLHKTKRLATAMKSPQTYFIDRQTQMELLVKDARDTFRDSYKKNKAFGLSDAQAKDKAESLTNKIMEVKFDEFNAEWPDNISDLVTVKLMKKSSVETDER